MATSSVAVKSAVATPLQQGMIFHGLRHPGRGTDIEQITVRSSRPLRRERLERAFAEVTRGHDILRARFEWEGRDKPVISIADGVDIAVDEHRAASQSALEQALEEYLEEDRRCDFDLAVAPLMRLRLFHANDSSVLVWTFHHLLLDGRSFPPLLEEVFNRYDTDLFSTQDRPGFLEYAQWLDEQDPATDLEFWKRHLAEVSAPCVFPQLSPQKKSARGYGSFELVLSAEETAKLAEKCADIGVSQNIALQAAWSLVLHHFSGTDEVIFGATYTTRYSEFEDAADIHGLMINTLPVRVEMSSELGAGELLESLSRHTKAVRPHLLAPLNLVQQQAGLPASTPLFDTAIVYDRANLDDAMRQRQPGWDHLQFTYTGQTNFALTLVAYGGECLSLRLEFDRARVDDEHGEIILATFANLLRELLAEPGRPATALPLLPARERERKLTPDSAGVPRGECLHQLFRRVAAEFPDNTALRCDAQSMTYRALDRRSDRVALALVAAGARVENKIGLCMERGNDLIVGLLGILKAGCAYVPIDPDYPDGRIDFTLNDAGIEHIVSDAATRERLRGFGRKLVIESEVDSSDASNAAESLRDIEVDENNLAYVIYTSGSTGTPKGVAVTHRNVARLMSSTQHWFGFASTDRWTLFHSIAFDWTVFEIWGALSYGGELNIIPYWVSRSPADFYRLLAEREITVLCQTPSAFLNLNDADETLHRHHPLRLRYVIFGGEALELASLAPWVERHGDANPQLVNMYGITETTVHVTYRRVTREDIASGRGSVIGEPIPDLDILLLNRHFEPVPPGVVAEICVTGEGLAREYLNRPELTRERFPEDIPGELDGVRLYRSGDLARWLPNGDLVYSGRADFQVKIRGFRIELGEIENALASIAGVRQVVVVAASGPGGSSRLVAYYVAKTVSPAEVGEAAADLLPAHMLPAHIIQLPELPLTVNGKIDRQRLPDPEFSADSANFRAPANETEQQLAAIWKEILSLQTVGIDDDFFELGGDSILSIQLISRARKAGIVLTVQDLYRNPTIAALAASGSAQPGSAGIAQRVEVGQDIPLLPVQRWFFDAVGNEQHWNQSFTFRVRQSLSANTLSSALEAIARHHPILSASYQFSESGWRQQLAADSAIMVRETSLDEAYAGNRDRLAEFAAEINAEVAPGKRKNICAGLLGFNDDFRFLCLAIHHLVVDGITWNIIVRELDEILSSPTISVDYATRAGRPETAFAEWSRFLAAEPRRFNNESAYWKARTHLTASGPGRETGHRHGRWAHYRQEFDSKAWPSRSGVTRQAIVVAAFAGALAETEARTRVRFELESHGRDHELSNIDLANAAGWFTSIYPFCVPVADSENQLALLESVHRELLQVPNNGIGYGQIQASGEAGLDGYGEHLFNYMGNFAGLFENCDQLELVDPFYAAWRNPDASHSHPCEWIVAVNDGEIQVDASFDPACFSADRIEEITRNFLRRIESSVALVESRQLTSDKLLVTASDWEQASSAAPAATRILPVTPIQELYLFGSRGGPDIGVEQWYLKFEGRLDPTVLREAWADTLASHSGLNTTFPSVSGGRSLQAFNPRANFEWRSVKLDPGKDLAAIRREDQVAGLNLVTGPLHRFSLVDAGDETFYLLWTHHHVHIDGWSWPLVLNQVHDHYRRRLGQGDDFDDPGSSDYAGYVDWITRSRPWIDTDYWKDYLQGLEADGRLPAGNTGFDGVSTRSEVLDSALGERLGKAATMQGVTLSSLFHLAWAGALGSLMRRRSVCIGSAFSGRPAGDPDFTSVAGPFVTNLPLRVILDDPGSQRLLQAVHGDIVEHQSRQYHSPAEIQEASGLPWVIPIFESLLVFQNYQIADTAFDLGTGVEVKEIFAPVRTNFPLTIVVNPGQRFKLDFIFDRSKLEQGFIEEAITLVHDNLVALVEGRPFRLAAGNDYSNRLETAESVSPRGQAAENEVEEKLVQIWRNLFGDERIGITDNFFDLGGRSIMVPVLMSRIGSEFGASVPFATLFRDPTIRGLARHMPGAGEVATGIASRIRDRADRSKSALRKAREKKARRGMR